MKLLRPIACAAFFLVFPTSTYAPRAADMSPSASHEKPVALPAGHKATLRFLQPKVAAGAIANSAHRAPFEIIVVDALGKRKAGALVPLPVVASGGRASKAGVSARVEWVEGTQVNIKGLGVTDAKGIARGLFTSGNRTETTILMLPVAQKTAATASIVQVYNELDGGDKWDEEPFDNNEGTRIRYTMRFQRAEGAAGKEEWEPITGHKMKMELRGLTILQQNPHAGPDEDGDGAPDGESQERVISKDGTDEATWKSFASLVTFDEVREVEPGVYATALRMEIPQDAEGNVTFEVLNWNYDVLDYTSFDGYTGE